MSLIFGEDFISMKIKLYWWRGGKLGLKNFGDWLSPLICEAISGKKVVFAKPESCDLIAIGSLLKKLNKTGNWLFKRKIAVWGTGSIGEDAAKYPKWHNYYAVRGKKSLELIPSDKSVVLGDPGLLCEHIYCDISRNIKNTIGIVPHYKDRNNELVKELCKKSKYFIYIDVCSDPITVIKQIASCRMILSSSLHGLVVADALHIPNAWIKLSNLVGPNDFKFYDYYSIYGLSKISPFPLSVHDTPETIEVIQDSYKRDGLENIKKALLEAFPF
jgi:hypothetical protein